MNENNQEIGNQLNPQNNPEAQNNQNKDIEIKPMKEKKVIMEKLVLEMNSV